MAQARRSEQTGGRAERRSESRAEQPHTSGTSPSAGCGAGVSVLAITRLCGQLHPCSSKSQCKQVPVQRRLIRVPTYAVASGAVINHCQHLSAAEPSAQTARVAALPCSAPDQKVFRRARRNPTYLSCLFNSIPGTGSTGQAAPLSGEELRPD